MTGFFGGKCLAESDLENGVETENPDFFLSDPEFCRKEIFPAEHISWKCCDDRGVFFLFLLFLCGFTIFGVPLSVAYMLILGNGDRTYSGIIRSGIWYLRRCGRRRTSDSSVCDLYSGIFLSCRSLYTDSPMRSGKTMGLYLRKSRLIFQAGNGCISGVYRGNSCRKFPESVDS